MASPSASHDHDHAHDGHHGLAHVAPLWMLFAVWAALMVLTVFTVSVTSFDFGYTVNLLVAMAIAAVKAALVMAFFMHLLWDKPFNVLMFLGSMLFVALFITLTMQDRREYQDSIDQLEQVKATKEAEAN